MARESDNHLFEGGSWPQWNHSIVATTFTSTAIGVGNALISIVVRVGLGLPLSEGPAKYSAYTAL